VSGWNYLANLGNTDGDPQPELLFYSDTDGHYAIFDGRTGALEQEFPAFAYPDCFFQVLDFDSDGLPELFFHGGYSGPALCRAYRWGLAGYYMLFEHTDRFNVLGLAHVRSTTAPDFIEYTADDIRIREPRGLVVWRASQNVHDEPPYNGFLVDVDQDGLDEMFFMGGLNGLHLFKYVAGSFAHQWTVLNQLPWWIANTRNSQALQIGTANAVDGHFGIYDALTGALLVDVPDFTMYTGAQFIPVELVPGGGRYDLLLWQPPLPGLVPPPVPMFRLFHWDGTGYVTRFTHNDPISDLSFARFRSPLGESEFAETDREGGDVRIRTPDGAVLFRASTDIPAWTPGIGSDLLSAFPVDFTHDGSGVMRLLINDGLNAAHLVSYSGTFSRSWVASGWFVGQPLGNTDGDPQDELFAIDPSLTTYGVLDGLSGALDFTPSDYSALNSTVQPYDPNGDGRNELLMVRFSFLPGDPPSLADQFRWNGTGYSSMFQLSDSLLSVGPARLRDGVHYELTELLSSGDLLLRDALTGQLLFRASTDLAGWTPPDLSGSGPYEVGDFDGDGVDEILSKGPGTALLLDHPGSTAVPGGGAPAVLRVLPSSPNPFRTATTLRFELPRAGQVGVRVFDTAGRLVRRLDQAFPAGPNAIAWDGLDEAGNPAPNGVLFYQVTADGVRQTSKIVRME